MQITDFNFFLTFKNNKAVEFSQHYPFITSNIEDQPLHYTSPVNITFHIGT